VNPRRNGEAAQRAAERRQRENDAARLHAEVPRLETLRLEIQEQRGDGVLAAAAHIRRIVVEHAPALFVVQCSDRSCKDGGHDLTAAIMRELAAGSTRFEGEHACDGRSGSVPCTNILRYVGVATYK